MSVSEEWFEQRVTEALDQVPPALAKAMDNVVVLIADRNPDDPGLLGLYEGVPLNERAGDYAGSLPDRITVYRDALLARFPDESVLAHEVRVTVLHEIGHHFGIDENRLHELGWG